MSGSSFPSLGRTTRTYVACVVVAGATTVLLSLSALLNGQVDSHWVLLGLLTLASGSATVHLASIPVAISISETFVFTAALLFGPAAGTLTVALDAAVISFWSYRRGQPVYKIAFNVCALPLTMWLSAHLFFTIADIPPLFRTTGIQIRDLLGPLTLFTAAYFTLSSWIVTIAISLERREPPFAIWRHNFLWISLNYVGGAFVALLLVSYSRDLDFTILILVVPILAILYATYAATVGRYRDANQHLKELNSLYMATIETLAMAIDAKDQVTHGHIRRVQTYAVELARRLGVDEALQIRAIEAAALLHDMGKLAVPEYILNKPGPLTPAEFERMKLHASVGADILASIKFPYPVVPIVRHHHENWDGTGYPDGLKGTEIPIGARILSVVDCFDALTSDRPYRPKLSDADAIKILRERRGKMYDPLIVDKFLEALNDLTVGSSQDHLEAAKLHVIGRVALPVEAPAHAVTGRLEAISSSTEEMLVLYDLARNLAGTLELSDAGDVIANHLRRIVPLSVATFFTYDTTREELVAAHTIGDLSGTFTGLRIARGERLTGWVAANLKTIVNSDPVLDLGDRARRSTPRLRSCLSAPLLDRGRLVGVLSLYSIEPNAFTDDHRRIVEIVARQISRVVSESQTQNQQRPIPAQGEALPNVAMLASFIAAELEERTPSDVLSIVLVEVNSTNASLEESFVTVLVQAIRQGLRGADILSRHGARAFIVLLAQTDALTANLVIGRIRTTIADALASSTVFGPVEIQVAASTAPDDGHTLDALIRAAKGRLASVTRRVGNRSVH